MALSQRTAALLARINDRLKGLRLLLAGALLSLPDALSEILDGLSGVDLSILPDPYGLYATKAGKYLVIARILLIAYRATRNSPKE